MLKIEVMNPFSKLSDGIKLILISTMLISASSLYAGDDEKLKKGSSIPASEVSLISTSGDTTSLQDLKDEMGLVVVFSCNTCPFVVGSEKFAGWEEQYNSLFEKAREANLGFVLINSNEAKRDGVDSMEEMKKHAEENEYKMPYLLDKDHVVADAFIARTTPHVYVFDKNGYLIYQGAIDNTWDSDRKQDENYLISVVENIAAGHKIKQDFTSPKGCSIKRTKQ